MKKLGRLPSLEKAKKSLASTLKSTNEHLAKAYLAGGAAFADMGHAISQTDFFSSLNTYKSELSKAMDEGFKIGSIDLETGLKMMPNNHRILDGGHGFFESIQKAKEIGETNNWSDTETFTNWLKAFSTDLTSPAGMPAFDHLTDNIYSMLRTFGFSEETARDLVTINGQEAAASIAGGSIAAVSLFFAWNQKDRENFSKAVGSIGLGALLSANPFVLAILLVAAGIGYNNLVCKKAILRGATISTASLATSFLIPGPALLGLLPAIVVGIYVSKKMGKDFDVTAQLKLLVAKLNTTAGRDEILKICEDLLHDLTKKVQSPVGAAG